MTGKSTFPRWFEGDLPARSFRSLAKWGDARRYKHPNKRLFKLMKETFGLDDAWFAQPRKPGLETVPDDRPPRLEARHLEALRSIVGAENASTDTYSRLGASYGKTMIDLLRLRDGVVENLPDIVLRPRGRADLRAVVDYCDAHAIPLQAKGGGSSVVRGFEAVKGGVTLDMQAHLNRVLAFDETNQTITVEAGLAGPALEALLNDAPRSLGARRRYTCGHFPQSFEHSTVGGWVVTRGAGQNSTSYGKIENLVAAQDYVCPGGELRTRPFPAAAHGPDIDQIMMGGEGAFGVLYSATLKLHRHQPQNTQRFSFVFRTWDEAKDAAREIMQGEFGRPSVFRLSDAEETDVALKLYGVEGTPLDWLLQARGYRKGERCLMLGTAVGDADYAALVHRKVREICGRRGAMSTSGLVVRQWEHGRFLDPYLRDDLLDFGVVIDTLECSVTWSDLERVHTGVRDYVHSRPRTICMTHGSHFYAQGCNLYFIFIARMDSTAEYLAYQAGLLDAIQKSGASMSHHHGIGRMTAPWLEGDVGPQAMALFRALKRHFDPNNVMNPGGTLALDLPDAQRRGVA